MLKFKQLPEIWGRQVDPRRAQETGRSTGGRMRLGDWKARKARTELPLSHSKDRRKGVTRYPVPAAVSADAELI